MTYKIPGNRLSGVPLPWKFLQDKNLLGAMARRRDARAFGLLLYLWKLADARKSVEVSMDYSSAAAAMGMDLMTPEGYRRQINKTLRKLQTKYGLIEAKIAFNKNARVMFPRDIAAGGPDARIPYAFWDYGWCNILNTAGQVMYLIQLAQAEESTYGQTWSRSRKTLAARYHVPAYFLSVGNTELRRWNLLTIEYDRLLPEDNKSRKPNRYLLGELYDPKQQEDKLRELENRHGRAALARAKKLAALVYEDHDINGIKTLIALEAQVGRKAMHQAAAAMALKSSSNPKRTMGYLINTIRKIAAMPAAN